MTRNTNKTALVIGVASRAVWNVTSKAASLLGTQKEEA